MGQITIFTRLPRFFFSASIWYAIRTTFYDISNSIAKLFSYLLCVLISTIFNCIME